MSDQFNDTGDISKQGAEFSSADEQLDPVERQLGFTMEEAYLDVVAIIETMEAKASEGTDFEDDSFEFHGHMNGLYAAVEASGDVPAHLPTVIELLQHRNELETAHGVRPNASRDILSPVIYKFGAEQVGLTMAQEAPDGPIHTTIMTAVVESNQGSTYEEKGKFTAEHLKVLEAAYDTSKPTELLGLQGGEYEVELRKQLIGERGLQRIERAENVYDSEAGWQENKDRFRKWTAEALGQVADIDPDLALEIAYTTSRKQDTETLATLLGTVDYFGSERLQAIMDTTNIQGFEAYSIPQLEMMERFANKPNEVAEDLIDRDVSVVMINRSGDHNGIMQNVADTYDVEGATLFFEINSLGDVYKTMTKMKKAGIKPSTLVLAAHSNPGNFVVADLRSDEGEQSMQMASMMGNGSVEKHNREGTVATEQNRHKFEKAQAFSIADMDGVSRIVSEYMQPSRAIDDIDEQEGRVKIIFNACSIAEDAEAFDRDEHGEKFSLGESSMIGSLGEKIAEAGIETPVDIFGAAEGMQPKKTENGVRFTGQPVETERVAIDMKKVSVEHGAIEKHAVAELTLRRGEAALTA